MEHGDCTTKKILRWWNRDMALLKGYNGKGKWHYQKDRWWNIEIILGERQVMEHGDGTTKRKDDGLGTCICKHNLQNSMTKFMFYGSFGQLYKALEDNHLNF